MSSGVGRSGTVDCLATQYAIAHKFRPANGLPDPVNVLTIVHENLIELR